MILKIGNMWNTTASIVVVTGNATIRKDGCLVMGRGAAKEAVELFPGCDATFGKLIALHKEEKGPHTPYGVIVDPKQNPGQSLRLALFQVKWEWHQKADLELITYSVEELYRLALHKWKRYTIALNFPGIGNGGLLRRNVLPIIDRLPDNVEVWQK